MALSPPSPRSRAIHSPPSAHFDLTFTQSSSIVLRSVLNTEQAITFPAGSIFNCGTAFTFGGLDFVDTGTDTDAPRDRLCTFTDSSHLDFSLEAKGAFITLTPGTENLVEYQLGAVRSLENISSSADGDSINLEMFKWHSTRDLEDGQTYQVCVHDSAGISEWFFGAKEGILSEQKGWSI